MKFKATVLGLLLCALMVTGAMCQSSPALQKPKVSYVPAGWYLSADDAYNPELGYGLVEYTDSGDGDFVMIFWGDIPASFVGHESDSNALIAQAVY